MPQPSIPETNLSPEAPPPRPHDAADFAEPPFRTAGSWLLWLVLAALLGGAILYAVHGRRAHEATLKEAAAQAATVPVTVVHPDAVASIEEIRLPGSAQSFQDTSIYARTSGYLKSWNVDIGTRVKQGEVLAEIETPEVDRQLEQARADLKNAQANLQLAQITATRAEDLIKKSTISSQERDQAQSDLAGKRASVDSSGANVKRLEQLQSFQKIIAPFPGVITARNTDVGSLIQAGDNSTAKELFHLSDNHIIRVFFSVPEIYAATVEAGAEVPVAFDALPGQNFTGKIVRDAATIDPRSHTLMVEADVDNPDFRLLAGGYTTLHLKLPATAGAVTVPANTLLFRSEGLRVAAVREGRVVLVPVQIGRDHGATLEVLGGLTPKDELVLDPADSLAEGTQVSLEQPAK